jgi:hypothetical protein
MRTGKRFGVSASRTRHSNSSEPGSGFLSML